MCSNLRDLIDTTHNYHYFNYRTALLRKLGRKDSVLPCDETFESEINSSRLLKEDMTKREEEMRQLFFQKV